MMLTYLTSIAYLVDCFHCFQIEPQPGGEFSWFGGSISGRFKELQADKQIVMDWRFNNWSEGCYSKVKFVGWNLMGDFRLVLENAFVRKAENHVGRYEFKLYPDHYFDLLFT